MTDCTPGPWKARNIDGRHGVTDIWAIDWSDVQEEVVELCHGKANAHLIAAAPTMCDALRQLKTTLIAVQGVCASSGIDISPSIEIASEALAKARGES